MYDYDSIIQLHTDTLTWPVINKRLALAEQQFNEYVLGIACWIHVLLVPAGVIPLAA
jgi:hypothetical protein